MNEADERTCYVHETSDGAVWGCRRCGATSGTLPSRGAARVAADAHRCPDEPARVVREYGSGRRRGLRMRRR
ncbi:hypothetical protein ACTHRK_03315 [Dietzia cercidiphylli]|uniref:hypothetical protein n=1 Tax=Dietzia cercidiphylli TaxID=498199 RepID=UPI003F7E13C3